MYGNLISERGLFQISGERRVFKFAVCAITKYHKLGVLKNENFLSHSSGVCKSKIKMSAGLIPSEGYEGRFCSRPLSFAYSWPSSRVLFVLVSISKFLLLMKTLVMLDSGPPRWPHFELITTAKNLSPNKVTFRGTWG